MPPKPPKNPNLFPNPKDAPIGHRGDIAAVKNANRQASPAILAARPAPKPYPPMGVPKTNPWRQR